MNNTRPKEILENIIDTMGKTHSDEWEIDKLVVVLNYINELENKLKDIRELVYDVNEDIEVLPKLNEKSTKILLDILER